MGILNGKHVFTGGVVTAIIIDEFKRGFFVPIMNPIGDYFITTLNNQVYAFRMVGLRVYSYRQTLAKSFLFSVFFTDHYLPIDPHLDELKLLLKKENLPRVDALLASILKFIGKGEKRQFEEHTIEGIIERLNIGKNENSEVTNNIITFLNGLGVKKIGTPVQPVSEFIEDDLIASDPKFFGSIVSGLEAADYEHRKISNTPINAKKPILKLMAICVLIGLVGFSVYIGYEDGWFDSLSGGSGGSGIIPSFEPAGPPSVSDQIMEKYSDPVDLKIAVQDGLVDLSSLPKDIQDLLDRTKIPVTLEAP